MRTSPRPTGNRGPALDSSFHVGIGDRGSGGSVFVRALRVLKVPSAGCIFQGLVCCAQTACHRQLLSTGGSQVRTTTVSSILVHLNFLGPVQQHPGDQENNFQPRSCQFTFPVLYRIRPKCPSHDSTHAIWNSFQDMSPCLEHRLDIKSLRTDILAFSANPLFSGFQAYKNLPKFYRCIWALFLGLSLEHVRFCPL